MVFQEKKRKKHFISSFFSLLLAVGLVFLFQTHIVEAGGHWWDPSTWVQSLLYGIFVMFGVFASLAITIFEWAIKPESIQMLMNSPGVYESWKFVRDFFNLFFILILLYIAFSVVFQIEKNFKKTLLTLVLAALFINFSYPVSRALIDMTNVPMYFFANQMMAKEGGGTDLFGQTMSASGLEHILLPTKEEENVSRILMAIVFIFIFSITLLVLSIMFVIRLVALVVLVIFSSVGFAATFIPGLSSYAGQWWSAFWKYAFFGPAAMLMLLVSVKFFSSIQSGGGSQSPLIKGMKTVAGTEVTDVDFYANMLLFSIPIVMLWMAMGLAQKMSIAGAGSVVGKGKGFAKWAGKKTYNNPIGRGLYGGAKKVVMGGKVGGFDYGKKLPGGKFLTGDYWGTPSKTEATIKGGIAGGWGGGAKERKKLDQQAVIDRVKKDKENQVNNSVHRDNLKNSKDPIEREAAALALANDKEIRTAEELSQAMDVLRNNTDGLVRAIEGAKSSAFENMDAATYQKVRDVHFEKDKNGNVIRDPVTHQATTIDGMDKSLEALDHRVVKEGNANVLVDYQVNNVGATRETAVEEVLTGIKSVKEKVKQESLFTDSRNASGVTRYVTGLSSAVRTELEKSAAQESPNVHNVISSIP